MTTMYPIEMGDIGIVLGRVGSFCVRGGAPPPSNIFPCSASAREAAEPSEALSLTDGTFCWRHEFIPMFDATRDQKEMAGICGWYDAVRLGFRAYW